MVNAYRYGAPPHAGFAFGLDRFVMELTGAESLRDVLAFPKLKDASCPLTDAPNVVDDIQLEELAICTADQLEKRAAQGGKGRSGSEGIDVEHVAKLAQLKITPAERETMRRELAQMVDFAGQLEKIDTTGVEPMAHIMPVFNVLRPDEPVPSFDRDLLLENTPAKEDGYIFVPQVVE